MGDKQVFPLQRSTPIPWAVARDAYRLYHERYPDQTLEHVAERGGFSVGEMDMFLPDWRMHVTENAALKEQVESLGGEVMERLTKIESLFPATPLTELHLTRERDKAQAEVDRLRGSLEWVLSFVKRSTWSTSDLDLIVATVTAALAPAALAPEAASEPCRDNWHKKGSARWLFHTNCPTCHGTRVQPAKEGGV